MPSPSSGPLRNLWEEQVITRAIRRFFRDDGGQDLIEYALLAALIGVATIGAMNALQDTIETEFNDIEDLLESGGS